MQIWSESTERFFRYSIDKARLLHLHCDIENKANITKL